MKDPENWSQTICIYTRCAINFNYPLSTADFQATTFAMFLSKLDPTISHHLEDLLCQFLDCIQKSALLWYRCANLSCKMFASAISVGVRVPRRVSGDVKSTSSHFSDGKLAINDMVSISTSCPSNSWCWFCLWACCCANTSSLISGGSAARNSRSISPSAWAWSPECYATWLYLELSTSARSQLIREGLQKCWIDWISTAY